MLLQLAVMARVVAHHILAFLLGPGQHAGDGADTFGIQKLQVFTAGAADIAEPFNLGDQAVVDPHPLRIILDPEGGADDFSQCFCVLRHAGLHPAAQQHEYGQNKAQENKADTALPLTADV